MSRFLNALLHNLGLAKKYALNPVIEVLNKLAVKYGHLLPENEFFKLDENVISDNFKSKIINVVKNKNTYKL